MARDALVAERMARESAGESGSVPMRRRCNGAPRIDVRHSSRSWAIALVRHADDRARFGLSERRHWATPGRAGAKAKAVAPSTGLARSDLGGCDRQPKRRPVWSWTCGSRQRDRKVREMSDRPRPRSRVGARGRSRAPAVSPDDSFELRAVTVESDRAAPSARGQPQTGPSLHRQPVRQASRLASIGADPASAVDGLSFNGAGRVGVQRRSTR